MSWDALIEEHGREIVQEACLLMAEASVRRLRKRNLEIDLLESWLKRAMRAGEGSAFIEERVKPGVEAYARWQQGQQPMVIDR